MKHLAFSLGLAVASVSAIGQDLMTVKYSIAFPASDLQEYIQKTSWRGLGFGFRHVIDGTVAVGVDAGLQVFYEKRDYDTYTSGTASVTGVQFRYTNSFQISAQADYVLNEGKDFRPYMGLGLGTIFSHRRTDFGLYTVEQDPWQFLMKPEVGITYYLSNGSAVLISGEYAVAFESSEMAGQSFMALNIGMVFDAH